MKRKSAECAVPLEKNLCLLLAISKLSSCLLSYCVSPAGHYFRVKTVADIAPILESFPRSEILKMLNKVSQYRDYILHHGVLYNIMEEQMCNAWENFKTPD